MISCGCAEISYVHSVLLKIRELVGQFDVGKVELGGPPVLAVGRAEASSEQPMSSSDMIKTNILVVKNEKLINFWIDNPSLGFGLVATDGVIRFLNRIRIKQI